ncbi:GNAT family N-acetyltransferase [Aeoliella sp. ICT_H6.2]|uniref:GNAT family N-acetyltransferase n=1 Tax=Aeoliella straminimaris TaxID=2954799 RepID=A0A9X2FDU1_9BACT|nr:GNAT family N-acetyltransferase [Aeoliella straminimaris]MCO6047252.1 GNAT family N-acetyltransferase [Aeoliella straminimaris]
MSRTIIRHCPPEKQQQALELVLQDVTPQLRAGLVDVLRPTAQQGIDVFAGLIIAEDDGKLVGAAWLQPQVGRTATLWPPILRGDITDDQTLCKLAGAAVAASRSLPVDLVQLLLDKPSTGLVPLLEELEFEKLADLEYLMHTVPRRYLGDLDPDVTFDSPAMEQQELLEQLVKTTYEQTLDCPGLEGRRNIEDVLTGYQAVGEYDPKMWYIVRWRTEPVGVLLTAPYPDGDQWEIVYVGIAPRFRGRRLGKKILAHLTSLAAQRKVEYLVVAVDAANAPALRVYEQSGYVRWAERTAYIRSIERSDAG